MKTDITQIIELIVTLICSVLTVFVLPIIKDRLSQSKREKLKFWVDTAVKAAEQIYGEKAGQQKKDHVVSFLLSKGIVFDIDEVTALIESSVYTLSSELC